MYNCVKKNNLGAGAISHTPTVRFFLVLDVLLKTKFLRILSEQSNQFNRVQKLCMIVCRSI